MYIRKSVLGACTIAAGVVFLMVLLVLFCFTEINIPVPVYVSAWLVGLGAMWMAAARIYR